MDNSGNTFSPSSYGGTWSASGATIKGGSVNLTQPLSAQNITLDGISGGLPGGQINTSNNLTIKDGLNFGNGSINTALTTSNTLTLDGPSQTVDAVNIVMGLVQNYGNQINIGGPTSPGPVTVTLGANADVQGWANVVSGNTYSNSLINNGTINANVKGYNLTISTSSFTNNKTFESNNGAPVAISSASWSNSFGATLSANGSAVTTLTGTWTNAGSITGSNGALMYLGGTSWINSGTITADSTSTITLGNSQWTNSGAITAQNGGTVNIASTSWSNASGGTIQAILGGILTLHGSFSDAGIGALSASADCKVNMDGTLNNSGNTFKPAAYGGSWNINGTIIGGTFDVSGTPINIGIAGLNGVQVIGGDLNLNQPTQSGLTVSNGLSVSTGNLNLIGPAAGVHFVGSPQTIDNLNINADSNNNGHGIYIGLTNSSAQVTFGSQTTISGGNLNFLDYYGGLPSQPTGTVINNGTIKADVNGDTVNLNNRYFTNNGLIEAIGGGSLSLGGTTLFTNTATIALSNGTISTSNGLDIGSGTLTGSGTIDSNLRFDDASQLDMSIGGTLQGSDYDALTVNGNVTLGGTLNVYFANGFETSITSNEQFVILTQTPGNGYTFNGFFNNVEDGGSLLTADGYGSFQINYGRYNHVDEVVLSNFQPVPEPTTLAPVCCGAVLLRRRPRSQKRE